MREKEVRRVPERIRSGPLKPKYDGRGAAICRGLVSLKGPVVRTARIISLRDGSWVRRVRCKPHAAVQAEPRPPGIISSGEHEINHPLLYIVGNGIEGHLEHMIAHLWNAVNLHGEKTGVIPAWRQIGRHMCGAGGEEGRGRRERNTRGNRSGTMSQRKGNSSGEGGFTKQI